ncbi:hypothetical protein BHE74_00044200, partial [Ensete ventricosum]
VLICSFCWYTVPGYFFPTITSMSWVCWLFSKSVTAQQLGSGLNGLAIGAFTLDWSTVVSFLGSPLVSPFFAIVNVFIGFVTFVYVAIPVAYWGLNLFDAKTFPVFSSELFAATGQKYNITAIVNDRFEIDMAAYEEQGRMNLSMFFALSYGFGFAAIAATFTHVMFFYGREIHDRYRASYKGKPDIHTRLMHKYADIPGWWFYSLLLLTVAVSVVLCTVLKDQVQLPVWGLFFACALAFVFTLPISIITATTNQVNNLSHLFLFFYFGFSLPSGEHQLELMNSLLTLVVSQCNSIVRCCQSCEQLIGTIIAGTINIGVAHWMLGSIDHICDRARLPPNSPWTCPGDRVFFDASVIWGLVGPRRIFGPLGNYGSLNWFFLGGALGPVLVWGLHRAFPARSWIPLVNLPVLLGATGNMPPASPINFTAWVVVGTVFNYAVYRRRKKWWERYNYILSAAMDAGVAFMGVLLYFALNMENTSIDWWGIDEHCPLATCPTAKAVQVDGCPVF